MLHDLLSHEELEEIEVDESNLTLLQLASVGGKKKKGGTPDLCSIKPSPKSRWGRNKSKIRK